MRNTVPKVCPLFQDEKVECDKFIENLNKQWGEGYWNRLNLCAGGLGLDEPLYLQCPVFSRWFWEKASHSVGQKVLRIKERGGNS